MDARILLFSSHIMQFLKRYLFIGRTVRLLSVMVVLACCWSVPAWGGKLVLKIQAVNKSESPQPVEIRSSLPGRISTNNIIDLDGLNLGYDVKSDTYYVYDTVELAPKEILVKEVEMEDIWRIDEAELEQYQQQTERLGGMLRGSEFSAKADEQRDMVKARSQEILTRQRENGIAAVSPIRHIQAYEANLKALKEVKQGVGKIENLTMAAGLNPGETLIGDDRMAAIPRRDVHFPKEYREALVKITVHNSSETQTRLIDVRRNMPPEITIDDVLDPGELDVRYDPKARVTYVYKDDVELAPEETRTFEVRIRDKWNVNNERMAFLKEKTDQLLVQSSGREKIKAVENVLNGAVEKLESVQSAAGPKTLSPAYIAFYRRQADKLDAIERDLNRVDAALKPLETKRGFDIPAPERKTTWLIIYIILGFLALVSLLFFLRWYIKSA